MADRAGEQSLKKSISLAMATSLQEPLLQTANYPEWYDLFAAFDRFRPKDEKTVFILDEYQYLCQVWIRFYASIRGRQWTYPPLPYTQYSYTKRIYTQRNHVSRLGIHAEEPY